jgi:hypothetical protein
MTSDSPKTFERVLDEMSVPSSGVTENESAAATQGNVAGDYKYFARSIT